MRPRAIVLFERLYLVSLAIGLVVALVAWSRVVRTEPAVSEVPGAILVVPGVTTGLILILVLLTSRARSTIAKYLLVLLFVLGAAFKVANAERIFEPGLMLVPQLFQIALQMLAFYCLFTEEARLWFKGQGG